jgi:hypothetical protein
MQEGVPARSAEGAGQAPPRAELLTRFLKWDALAWIPGTQWVRGTPG